MSWQVKNDPSRGGNGTAAAAWKKMSPFLLLSLLSVVLAMLFSQYILMPGLSGSGGRGLSPEKNAMRKIAVALMMYAARNDERFPDALSVLYHNGYLADLEYFDSPELPGKVQSPGDIDAGADYIYLAAGSRIAEERAPVLRQNADGGLVLFLSKKEMLWSDDLEDQKAGE